MAVQASAILDRVTTILQDKVGATRRWDDPELLQWIDDGQKTIFVAKPDANTKNTAIRLVSGTKQSLPADGYILFDIVRNMTGASGNQPGRAIRPVTRDLMDRQDPNWHLSTADSTVVHFIYDPSDQYTFYVYPPQPASGTGFVEIKYAAYPVAPSSRTDNIDLDDSFSALLVDYVLFRAFSKDAEVSPHKELADAHLGYFTAALSALNAAQEAKSANERIGTTQ